MLNELSHVVDAIERLGTSAPPLHPRIKQMGKNRELLVVRVGNDAMPRQVEVVPGDVATTFSFIEHGSNGCSFPGFNIPTPLRALNPSNTAQLESIKSSVDQLLRQKTKKPVKADVSAAIANLFELSSPRNFSKEQSNKFQRSCSDLAAELIETFANPPDELTNFIRLLEYIDTAKPCLCNFAEVLAGILATEHAEIECSSLFLFQKIIFGALNWKNGPEFGTNDYWREKAEQDKGANQPVYLDIAEINTAFKRVANAETSAAILKLSLERRLANKNAEYCQTKAAAGKARKRVDEEPWVDAFSGEVGRICTEFPSPRVAELGDLKLFSVNSKETKALFRYGLGGWQIFPVAEDLARRFNSELSNLAGDSNKGKTCCPIPGNRTERDKRTGKTRVVKDLLVAYLDKEPQGRASLAEMFGGEMKVFSDADFETVAKPVIELLEAKVKQDPNLDVRLLAFCSIDNGRKQISFNRRLHVRDVLRAANDWQAGARNVPAVTVDFRASTGGPPELRFGTTPRPLDLASTINQIWSASPKNGFRSDFHRAISIGDAFDVFMADSPLAQRKAEAALGLLVRRMSVVLAGLGAVRTTCEWTRLSDTVRWQSLKAIALLGILLRQLGHHRENFMRESITQCGRLLALADSLHLQYCKHVRKGESPSQLIGNALFSTALEQPVFALARLAERLTPYQAWARTFQSDDPKAGVGLVKWFLGEIAACTSAIHLEQLPDRMLDADKAKLLLGYLADAKNVDNQEQ
jgi:hypothetical protein